MCVCFLKEGKNAAAGLALNAQTRHLRASHDLQFNLRIKWVGSMHYVLHSSTYIQIQKLECVQSCCRDIKSEEEEEEERSNCICLSAGGVHCFL